MLLYNFDLCRFDSIVGRQSQNTKAAEWANSCRRSLALSIRVRSTTATQRDISLVEIPKYFQIWIIKSHCKCFCFIPRAEMISCITKSSSWIISTPSLSQKNKHPGRIRSWLKPLSGAKDPIEINGFRKKSTMGSFPQKNRGFPSFIIQLWDLGHVSDGEFLPRGHSGLRHHPR